MKKETMIHLKTAIRHITKATQTREPKDFHAHIQRAKQSLVFADADLEKGWNENGRHV